MCQCTAGAFCLLSAFCALMMYYFDKRAQRILHKNEAAVGSVLFVISVLLSVILLIVITVILLAYVSFLMLCANVYASTGSSKKHEFACISVAALHIDTSFV